MDRAYPVRVHGERHGSRCPDCGRRIILHRRGRSPVCEQQCMEYRHQGAADVDWQVRPDSVGVSKCRSGIGLLRHDRNTLDRPAGTAAMGRQYLHHRSQRPGSGHRHERLRAQRHAGLAGVHGWAGLRCRWLLPVAQRPLGTIVASGSAPPLTDTTVQPNQTSLYGVRAQDGVGQISASSNIASVQTPAYSALIGADRKKGSYHNRAASVCGIGTSTLGDSK